MAASLKGKTSEEMQKLGGKLISEIDAIDTKVVKEIETKLFEILEEDKKLAKPVFIFIDEKAVSKTAYFLAKCIRRPVAIGIAGETASGKSTFTYDVIEALTELQNFLEEENIITRINTDDYYYDRSDRVKKAGGFAQFAKNYDFDVPEAFELELLTYHLEQLVLGNSVMLPKYDMSGTAVRFDNHTPANPAPLVITEGLFNLTDKVKHAFDFCIYVDVSREIQKERWYRRAAERNLGDAAHNVYNNAVEKAEIHIRPSMKNADIIISGEAEREDYKKVIYRLIEIYKDLLLFEFAIK